MFLANFFRVNKSRCFSVFCVLWNILHSINFNLLSYTKYGRIKVIVQTFQFEILTLVLDYAIGISSYLNWCTVFRKCVSQLGWSSLPQKLFVLSTEIYHSVIKQHSVIFCLFFSDCFQIVPYLSQKLTIAYSPNLLQVLTIYRYRKVEGKLEETAFLFQISLLLKVPKTIFFFRVLVIHEFLFWAGGPGPSPLFLWERAEECPASSLLCGLKSLPSFSVDWAVSGWT